MGILKHILIENRMSKMFAPMALSPEKSEIVPTKETRLSLDLSPHQVLLRLLFVSLLLTFLSVLGHVLQYFFGRDTFVEFVRLVNLGGEQNIPTWFTSILLFTCALLLAYIAIFNRRNHLAYTRHWQFLAIIFLYLSLDAVAVIHDRTIEDPLVDMLDPTGIFHFPWVIPAWGVVIILAMIYRPFLRELPGRIRSLFIAAAIFYLGGALVLEMGSAYLMDRHVEAILIRGAVATGQEFFEMLGLIIFIYGLLLHIGPDSRDDRSVSVDHQPMN